MAVIEVVYVVDLLVHDVCCNGNGRLQIFEWIKKEKINKKATEKSKFRIDFSKQYLLLQSKPMALRL